MNTLLNSWQRAKISLGKVKIAVKVDLNSKDYPRGILEAGDYDFFVDDYFLEIEKNPFNLLKICMRFWISTSVFNIRAQYNKATHRYVLENQSFIDIRAAIRACFTHSELKNNSELVSKIDNDAMQVIDKFCGDFAFAHATQFLETKAQGGLKEKYLNFKGVA